jgi:hypothetical protein
MHSEGKRVPKKDLKRLKPSGKQRGHFTESRLSSDWKEFLLLLISHRVKFLLIGGHALAAHAQARFTEDLDIWVEASITNAKRIHKVFVDFGFGDVVPNIAALAKKGKVFMLGRKPYRIDLLTDISGVVFEDAWKSRKVIHLAFGTVPVIGLEALILNKIASGRPKDLADLEILKRK